MPIVPSLLDHVDLGQLRRAAGRYPQPGRSVFACLLGAGVLQHDPADPAWRDRDRVVVAGPRLTAAAAAAFGNVGYESPATGFFAGEDGSALALACGMASASAVDGGVFRVWCLLDETVCEDGWVWEAACTARAAGHSTLTGVLVGAAPRARALLAAAGWGVVDADGNDPCDLLGAFDQVIARTTGPQLVVAR